MAEKLKVSREVAEVLENLNRKELNTSTWLEMHSHKKWESAEKAPLNTLSLEEFATALIVGYEVEMTPHERIAAEYIASQKDWVNNGHLHSKGFAEGIKFTLNAQNIKVEGVNDHDNS